MCKFFVKTIAMTILLAVCLVNMSCEETEPSVSEYQLNLSDCIGTLEQDQSCASLITRTIVIGNVGCWIMKSKSDNLSSKLVMNWNGSKLSASEDGEFPWQPDDQISMSLYFFSQEITSTQCNNLEIAAECTSSDNCILRLDRENFTLSDDRILNFQDEEGQCTSYSVLSQSPERCDGLDNDCDGTIDEDIAYVNTLCEEESDSCILTGELQCNNGVEYCLITEDRSDEICDGQDNDCDGAIDESFNINEECSVLTEDECAVFTGVYRCNQQGEQICLVDEEQIAIPPLEVCDGQDNDCDGRVDEVESDLLGEACLGEVDIICQYSEWQCSTMESLEFEQGMDEREDMNITDPELLEAQRLNLHCEITQEKVPVELCGDEMDNDCDGEMDEGFDKVGTMCRKGSNQCAQFGEFQCSDNLESVTCVIDNEIIPSNEICDGQDNDCDGEIDEGFNIGSLCEINPLCGRLGRFVCVEQADGNHMVICQGANDTNEDEVCDYQDNDCDGKIDEGIQFGDHSDETESGCSVGVGACKREGAYICADDKFVCSVIAGESSTELCGDGIDNDCDGDVDERFPVNTNCYISSCRQYGTHQCTADLLDTECVFAGMNIVDDCNLEDDDCDGKIDEDFTPQPINCPDNSCIDRAFTQCNNGVINSDSNQLCTIGQVGGSINIREDRTCDGIDNDCDGSVDEFYVPRTITCGQGLCANTIETSCGPGGIELDECEPLNDIPDDNCDGLDNDCDGAIDESYQETSTCGIGICQNTINLSCNNEVVVGNCLENIPLPQEICGNQLDDNCNGQVDEVLEPCMKTLESGCILPGVWQCTFDNQPAQCVVDTDFTDQIVDTCDGFDNDCDSQVDENHVETQCDLNNSVSGNHCTTGRVTCNHGVTECTSVLIQDEVCNLLDDDCDGDVDEGDVCADLVVSQCEVWLGWVDVDLFGQDFPRDTWGNCAGNPEDISFYEDASSLGCVSSGRDQKFHRINIYGDADFNDWLGIRWSCDDSHSLNQGENEVLSWVKSNCHIALAYSDHNNSPNGLLPTTCPHISTSTDGTPHCIKTPPNGQFAGIRLEGDVGRDDHFAIAFWCDASTDEYAHLSDQLMQNIAVYLGLFNRGVFRGCREYSLISDEWGDCPDDDYDDDWSTRCTSSRPEGTFRSVKPEGDLNNCDQMSIALIKR